MNPLPPEVKMQRLIKEYSGILESELIDFANKFHNLMNEIEVKRWKEKNELKDNDFKYPKEVQMMWNYVSERILELVKKVEKKDYDESTLIAFRLGLMIDLDDCLIKLKKEKNEQSKNKL